ncbi:zinc ribbon domain-containing protein [Streptomyces sp. NRRL B-1381]|uniref:zinc ribbon domain-containing protein n=1 Tax=Streptomyces sp. NRRL B-1381 TaxID=1463829 RepID=UPI001F2CAC60|nr:zinc ribbon domain-containing protein [Streptomyces sp. NRRL B-1381]
MELRAIQRRNRDATVKTRAAGRPKGMPSYGFQYVRKVMGGKIDQVELHPHASEVLRNVARRILADPDNVTCSSEAARLNRAAEPSPADHLAVTYGKLTGGRPWLPQSLKNILLSEATLGYLMHRDRPVLGRGDGHPVRFCEGLWDRATHEALRSAILSRKAPWIRRSNREYLLTTVALCGQCHTRLYTQTSKDAPPRYTCMARNKGWLQAQHCRPAPLINAHLLDAYVEEWFLRELGDGVNGGPVGSKSGMGSQTGSQLLDGQGAVEDEIRSLLYGGDVFSVTRAAAFEVAEQTDPGVGSLLDLAERLADESRVIRCVQVDRPAREAADLLLQGEGALNHEQLIPRCCLDGPVDAVPVDGAGVAEVDHAVGADEVEHRRSPVGSGVEVPVEVQDRGVGAGCGEGFGERGLAGAGAAGEGDEIPGRGSQVRW